MVELLCMESTGLFLRMDSFRFQMRPSGHSEERERERAFEILAGGAARAARCRRDSAVAHGLRVSIFRAGDPWRLLTSIAIAARTGNRAALLCIGRSPHPPQARLAFSEATTAFSTPSRPKWSSWSPSDPSDAVYLARDESELHKCRDEGVRRGVTSRPACRESEST